MTRPDVLAVLVAAALAAGTAAVPELAEGERLYAEGDFEGTVLAVDRVARQLAADPSRGQDAARAYVLLGAAYVGMRQETIAESKFRQALQRAPTLRLSEDEFPARILRAFEAARVALAERRTLEKDAARKTGKTPWLLLGLGGAGAAGAAVALKGERANTPPTAAISVSPSGVAMVHATVMSFTATASDAEGDTLRYSWSFGDGETASGAAATHVFRQEGTFQVALDVNDGLQTTRATATAQARALTGRWRVTGAPILRTSEFELQQGLNGSLGGRDAGTSANATCRGGGNVFDPRRLSFDFKSAPDLPCLGSQGQFNVQINGEADSALQTITGTWFCFGGISSGTVVCRTGDSGSVMMVRQ